MFVHRLKYVLVLLLVWNQIKCPILINSWRLPSAGRVYVYDAFLWKLTTEGTLYWIWAMKQKGEPQNVKGHVKLYCSNHLSKGFKVAGFSIMIPRFCIFFRCSYNFTLPLNWWFISNIELYHCKKKVTLSSSMQLPLVGALTSIEWAAVVLIMKSGLNTDV